MTKLAALRVAHKHSSQHREEIARSTLAGCFHCLETYPVAEIAEWIDEGNSALCPRCGIDSVIGDASGYPVVASAFLGEMHDMWFGGLARMDLAGLQRATDE